MQAQDRSLKNVAIVIVNWNSFDLTKDTLLSLQKSNFQNFDCIVVDNGSADNSAEQLKNLFPEIILLLAGENKGFTGGNNIGMQYALDKGYEFIMMLNNDVEVDPNFLNPLVQKLKANEKMGAVQPLIYFHHDKNLIWNAGTTFNPLLGICATPNYNQRDHSHAQMQVQKKIDWITGCAFMIRASVLKQIGLLKEGFFIYYEDVDLSFRIKLAGYSLGYEPSSVIYHIAGMSHKSKEKGKEGFVSAKVHFLNARNKIWFLKQHTPLWAAPTVILFNAFYFFSIGFYFIFRARWQKWKAWNKGIWEGLTTNVA
jgi:GT2 family glycosyltransferase